MSAERYRLAWLSARRRARRYDDLVDSIDVTYSERCDELGDMVTSLRTERDAARATVERVTTLAARRSTALVSMQQQRDEARADAITNGQAAERLSEELAEARAQVAYLGKGFEDLRTDYERLAAQLEEMVNEAIHRAATDRLRTALAEERIEPERVNGHGKWCASLHAPPGQTYACDCNEVGAG